MSKENNKTAKELTNTQNAIVELWNANTAGEIASILDKYFVTKEVSQKAVLEALERYEDKILQILDKKADVKDYILQNRSRT